MNVDSPSTWVKFRPSLCRGCHSYCCTLPVEVSAEDLRRLGLLNEDEMRGSLKKPAKRLLSRQIIQSFRARTGLFILAQKRNGDCCFLSEDRLCTVYERRPEVCRRFPEVGPRPGYCPEMRAKVER